MILNENLCLSARKGYIPKTFIYTFSVTLQAPLIALPSIQRPSNIRTSSIVVVHSPVYRLSDIAMTSFESTFLLVILATSAKLAHSNYDFIDSLGASSKQCE